MPVRSDKVGRRCEVTAKRLLSVPGGSGMGGGPADRGKIKLVWYHKVKQQQTSPLCS